MLLAPPPLARPPFAALTAHSRSFAELEGAGFTRLEETKSWPGTLKPGGKYYVTRNQSSIIAFSVPPKLDTSKPTGISIVG
jgi:aspartyl aminopeptidase